MPNIDEQKILFIDACVRKNSRTRKLAEYVLSKLRGIADRVSVYGGEIKPLDEEALALRDRLISEGRLDDEHFHEARRFLQADIIVVAAPFWDLSFPACLKAYFESVNIAGITFRYENGTPKSLVKAKTLIYVTTSGGYISGENMGFSYVSALAKLFYGIEDIKYISAEGLDIIGSNVEKILDEAKKKADNLL